MIPMLLLLTTAFAGPTCERTTTLTDPSGTFTDGSKASDHYANDQDQCWVVSPECEDGVHLWFPRVAVERGYDIVHVHDGSGRLLTKTASAGDTFSGASFTVHFRSDHSITDTGFEAQWSCSLLPEEPPEEVDLADVLARYDR